MEKAKIGDWVAPLNGMAPFKVKRILLIGPEGEVAEVGGVGLLDSSLVELYEQEEEQNEWNATHE